MFKWLRTLWLDITNQTDENGFTKVMRHEKKKLKKLQAKVAKNNK
jgi:hypothetical protein